MTKTEEPLQEALAICRRITNRGDVSDDLLCSVYRSLELEQDLAQDRDEEDVETAGATLH
ncbi:hypothetical protein CDEF62S_05235 [Castellaniella defragrans]